jgi:hypothetical protein
VALYQRDGNYDKVLDCYFRDPHLKMQVFDYINKLMPSLQKEHPSSDGSGFGGSGDPSFAEEAPPPSAAVASVTKAVLSKLRSLITLDCGSTARLIRSVFPNQFSAVLVELKSLPPLIQYRHVVCLCSALSSIVTYHVPPRLPPQTK